MKMAVFVRVSNWISVEIVDTDLFTSLYSAAYTYVRNQLVYDKTDS